MKNDSGPFLGWPGWDLLRLTAFLGAGTGLWWVLIYGGADLLTRQHSFRVRLHFDQELAVPFVPTAVLGYMSLYPLLWAAPFILRRRRQLWALSLTLAAITLVAGVCFLLFPADPVFPPPPEMGAWTGVVLFAKRLALTHNLAPSLHVGLSVVCVAVFARRARPFGKGLLWAWSGVIAASTLFLHQHYLVDVVTGYALGLGGVRWVYDRLQAEAPRRPSDENLPANRSSRQEQPV